MTTPSEELAEKVISRLVGEGLILEADAVTLGNLLAQGRMGESDWRLAVEKASDKDSES